MLDSLRFITQIPSQMRTLLIANTLLHTAGAFFYPFVSLYLLALGATTQQVGIYATVQTFLAFFSRVFGGWVSDQLGRLTTLAIASVTGLSAVFVLSNAPSWQWTILAAMLGDIAYSLSEPSFQAYIAEKSDYTMMGRLFGLANTLTFLAFIIGSLVGGFLVEERGFAVMFWWTTAIYTLGTLLYLWLALDAPLQTRSLGLRRLVSDFRILFGLMVASPILFWLFITDGFSDSSIRLVEPFFSIYATDYGGFNVKEYGGLFVLMSLMGGIMMIPGGMFSDRYGEHCGIGAGAILYAILCFIMSVTAAVPAFIVVFILGGTAQAFIQPSFSALVSKSVKQETLGLTWGVYATSLGLLAIPAPSIGGYLYHDISPSAMFLTAAAFALIASVLSVTKLKVKVVESRKYQLSELQ